MGLSRKMILLLCYTFLLYQTSAETVFVLSGDTAFLECPCNSSDKTSFWIRNVTEPITDRNVIIPNLTDSVSFHNDRGYDLRIRNVSNSVTGCYICQCKCCNNAIYLKTIGEKKIGISVEPSKDIIEGLNVTFKCKMVNQVTNKNFHWSKDGLQIHSGRQLILQNISRNDSGVYGCTSGTTTIQTYLNVLYLPKVLVVQDGNKLFCKVSNGNPAVFSYIYWYHLTHDEKILRKINPNSDGILELVGKSEERYYLKNGKYICLVESGIEDGNGKHITAEGEIEVYLKGKPACLNGESITHYGELGEDISIRVDFYSNPEDVNLSWFRDGISIQPVSDKRKLHIYYQKSTTMIQSPDKTRYFKGFTLNLYLKALEENDVGKYSIAVSNIYGNCGCYFELKTLSMLKEWLTPLQLYILACGSVSVSILLATLIKSRCRRTSVSNNC